MRRRAGSHCSCGHGDMHETPLSHLNKNLWCNANMYILVTMLLLLRLEATQYLLLTDAATATATVVRVSIDCIRIVEIWNVGKNGNRGRKTKNMYNNSKVSTTLEMITNLYQYYRPAGIVFFCTFHWVHYCGVWMIFMDNDSYVHGSVRGMSTFLFCLFSLVYE